MKLKQYRSWSLPSKASYKGYLLGLIAIILTIVLFIYQKINSANLELQKKQLIISDSTLAVTRKLTNNLLINTLRDSLGEDNIKLIWFLSETGSVLDRFIWRDRKPDESELVVLFKNRSAKFKDIFIKVIKQNVNNQIYYYFPSANGAHDEPGYVAKFELQPNINYYEMFRYYPYFSNFMNWVRFRSSNKMGTDINERQYKTDLYLRDNYEFRYFITSIRSGYNYKIQIVHSFFSEDTIKTPPVLLEYPEIRDYTDFVTVNTDSIILMGFNSWLSDVELDLNTLKNHKVRRNGFIKQNGKWFYPYELGINIFDDKSQSDALIYKFSVIRKKYNWANIIIFDDTLMIKNIFAKPILKNRLVKQEVIRDRNIIKQYKEM